jgi:hypothetical protein
MIEGILVSILHISVVGQINIVHIIFPIKILKLLITDYFLCNNLWSLNLIFQTVETRIQFRPPQIFRQQRLLQGDILQKMSAITYCTTMSWTWIKIQESLPSELDTSPVAWIIHWVHNRHTSSRSRSPKGQMVPRDLCPDLYCCPVKFGWVTINIKGARAKKVFFCTWWSGDLLNMQISWVFCIPPSWHTMVPRDILLQPAVVPLEYETFEQTEVRSYVPQTDGHTEVSTICSMWTIFDRG